MLYWSVTFSSKDENGMTVSLVLWHLDENFIKVFFESLHGTWLQFSPRFCRKTDLINVICLDYEIHHTYILRSSSNVIQYRNKLKIVNRSFSSRAKNNDHFEIILDDWKFEVLIEAFHLFWQKHIRSIPKRSSAQFLRVVNMILANDFRWNASK